MTVDMSEVDPARTEGNCPFDPSESHRRLAGYARPGDGQHFGGGFAVVLSGYDEIREMLTSSAFTAVQPPFPAMSKEIPPGWFFGMDPPEHTRYRKLLAQHFSVRNMRRLAPMVERVADALLDEVAAKGDTAELMESYIVRIPTHVVCSLLGVSAEYHAEFRNHMRTIVSPEVADNVPVETLRAVQSRMWDNMAAVVRAKRVSPADDLISELLAADGESGPLSDEEVVGMAMTLMIAGNEAVENLLGMAIYALLGHPGQLAALRADPGLLDDAVEEFARYLPINNFGAVRNAVRDCSINGKDVKSGDVVLGLLSTANRDGSRFTDPDRMEIGREHMSNLAFGYGVHQCLGAHLARLEVRVGVSRLLARFPHLRLAVPVGDVKMRESVGFYGVDQLPVILTGKGADR